MPLPLPNLDDRRWADLVEEARALLPRYAPTWTDHNLSDPGITILDLLAWAVEADIYRVNRVTDEVRRKLVDLVGIAPAPPAPAGVVLSASSAAGHIQRLPAGLIITAAAPGSPPVPFRLNAELSMTGLAVAAVQVAAEQDGSGHAVADRTAALHAGAIEAFGTDPAGGADGPALLLGLEADPVIAPDDELTLAILLENDTDPDARRDAMARAEVDPRVHHGAATAWEWFDGAQWQVFAVGAVEDDTRALSISGTVRIRLPAAWPGAVLGTVVSPLRWLRCRLAAGRPDHSPRVAAVASDAVSATQAAAAWSVLAVAAGIDLPDGAPTPGDRGTFEIELDGAGRVVRLRRAAGVGIECTVLDWRAPAGTADGAVTLSILRCGPLTGEPSEAVDTGLGPVLPGTVRVVITDAGGGSALRWDRVGDFDAVRRDESAYALESMTGQLLLGDGDRGRTAPPGGIAWVGAEQTLAGLGTPPMHAVWTLDDADPRNRGVLGPAADLAALRADLAVRAAPASMSAGADAGSLDEAEGAAAERLWAHERLLEIATGTPPTLDQVPPDVVASRSDPPRACTLLDIERIARAVPGTTVIRARAWAGFDYQQPCLTAPGTVTVVVVPALPATAPQPTAGLLRLARAALATRRTLGTRLRVTGPRYLVVTVDAAIAIVVGGVAARIVADVTAALGQFLHPLRGGPAGLGWPFGRDVARSEILRLIGDVPGVDYVAGLTLTGAAPGCPQDAAGCGNLTLAPTMLVTSGSHRVVVV